MQEVNETTQTDENKIPTRKNHMRAHLLSRLAALAGVLTLGVLYLFLPDKLIIGPNWLLLVIEAALILPFVIALTTQRNLPHGLIRATALVTLGITTLALAIGIALLLCHGLEGRWVRAPPSNTGGIVFRRSGTAPTLVRPLTIRG